MRIKILDIAIATDGQMIGENVEVQGFATDTRDLVPGYMFIATRGKRNGHQFIPEALANGALAFMSDGAKLKNRNGVVVKDTVRALGQMGSMARRRFDRKTDVFGITGSAGKTSTKELLASILSRIEKTAYSQKSYNNEIGVPLTILNAATDIDSLVLEMGARHIGNIAYLCEFARPTIGVVTNVGLAHVGTFGGVRQIAQTKGELIASLPSEGTAVLNVMDENVLAMRSRTKARVITFGLGVGDVQARNISLDDELRATFRLHMPGGATSVFLQVRGEHQVMNAVAAAAAAFASGVSMADIVEGLEACEPMAMRMNIFTSPKGVKVIDDVYNANPISMQAALQALAQLPVKGLKYAVLGVMAELGDSAPAQHEKIAMIARNMGIDVISVNAPDYGVANYETADEAVRALGPIGRDDAVLVKGSRVAGLERAVSLIK